jgi:hypothetical protein
MGNGPTAETVRALEFVVAQHQAAIRESESELAKVQNRIVAIEGFLKFLKMAKAVRQAIDGTIVWRPGAILIVATAAGGVGLAVFQSPILGVVGQPCERGCLYQSAEEFCGGDVLAVSGVGSLGLGVLGAARV